ncbi:MAG: choice-of-anchor N protein [Nitrospirota bacterium]
MIKRDGIKEGFIKRGGILIIFIAMFLISLTGSQAFALPTLQTYIDGAIAGDYGSDEDTWWYVGSGTFNLYVVGAYGPNTQSLEGVTLLISIPEGETGTISISPIDTLDTPELLTTTGQGSASETNPTGDADSDILTDITGNDGYETLDFLPATFNSHYPLQDDVSDFILFDLYSFDDSESGLYDYNAEDGTITQASQSTGEQKEYLVTITGFTWAHFDSYGLETEEKGNNVVTTWEINPGSHDATYVIPEPGTLMLMGSGLLGAGLYGWRRRKRC